MRNNLRIGIAPSDPLGRPQGVTMDGTAIRVPGDEEIRVSHRRYGLMKMSFDIWGAIRQLDWAVFGIRV